MIDTVNTTEAQMREWIYNLARASDQCAKRPGFCYTSCYDLLQQHGRTWPYGADVGWTFAETELLSIIRRMRICFKIKQCYDNCYKVIAGVCTVKVPDGVKVQYVEGLAQGSILPVLHAWIGINGKVWDPTWDLLRADHCSNTKVYIGVAVPFYRLGRHLPYIDNWENNWPALRRQWVEEE